MHTKTAIYLAARLSGAIFSVDGVEVPKDIDTSGAAALGEDTSTTHVIGCDGIGWVQPISQE